MDRDFPKQLVSFIMETKSIVYLPIGQIDSRGKFVKFSIKDLQFIIIELGERILEYHYLVEPTKDDTTTFHTLNSTRNMAERLLDKMLVNQPAGGKAAPERYEDEDEDYE